MTTDLIYRFVLEIEADSEEDARERLETLIAQDGLGDLEGTYPAFDEGAEGELAAQELGEIEEAV